MDSIFANFQEPFGDAWPVNALQRATEVGQRTYARALERKVEWPPKFSLTQSNVVQKDPVSCTTLEEAFDTVQQLMVHTSKQCMKYYRSHPPGEHQEMAKCHCARFHTQRYTQCLTNKVKQSRQAEPDCYRQVEQRSTRQANLGCSRRVESSSARWSEPGCSRWTEPGCSRWTEPGCSRISSKSSCTSQLQVEQKHCPTCFCPYIQH